jgi:DNA-binding NtrC family response regulator
MSSLILVVDDDPVQRRLLRAAIEKSGHVVELAENGHLAMDYLKRHPSDVRVIVLDLMMPEMNGMEFMAALNALGLEIPVIVQTGQGGIETVVRAMREGAFDFVVKPVSPERIGMAIANALNLDQTAARARAGRKPRTGSISFEDIVSVSPPMQRVIDLAMRAAQSNIPVVLEGESGVGKEMVANAIRNASDRAGKPFITVNCGAIPANLVESILFGHEKGAFTGANEKHVGKFMEANNGTLFLDEIGDLPLDVQVKLLRAVQQGEIETVGSRVAQKVDVRLISATNKDLVEEVKAGRFREDLYYRLNVYPITIPALRRRKEDILALVRAFTKRFAEEQRDGAEISVNAGAMGLLTGYDWPGNIRQLENAIFRAVVLSDGRELTIDDFPQIAAQMPGYHLKEDGYFTFSPEDIVTRAMSVGSHQLKVFPDFQKSRSAETNIQDPFSARSSRESNAGTERIMLMPNAIASVDDGGEVRKLAEVEEELIRFALKFYRGQMSQVARKLGIGRSTLYRKLKDYGIDPDNPLQDVA